AGAASQSTPPRLCLLLERLKFFGRADFCHLRRGFSPRLRLNFARESRVSPSAHPPRRAARAAPQLRARSRPAIRPEKDRRPPCKEELTAVSQDHAAVD